MIPISMRESITFTDSDGIVFKFKPKSAALEREFMALCFDMQKNTTIDSIDSTTPFFNKIVLGWNGDGMPEYNEDPAQHFNLEERMAIFNMWQECNTLSAVNKKK